MRTTVRAVARALSGKELSECIDVAIRWQGGAVIERGPLHLFAERIIAETGLPAFESLQLAEAAAMREAALRFQKMETGVRSDEY